MARGIVFFFLIWAALAIGLALFRSMTKKEKWELLRTITVAGILASVAFALILGMVFIF